MGLFNVFILIPLVSATRRVDGPGFRSNVMEGDKPILRMAPNADYSEPSSDEDIHQNPPPKTTNPELVKDLSILVNWLMENFSYDLGPRGRKNNNEKGLRTHETKKKKDKPKPAWVKDLKEFIKDQTTLYGQQEVLEHATPIIASLEKKHNMKIRDIDVDEYGEIHITYTEKGKVKKTARKGEKTDET